MQDKELLNLWRSYDKKLNEHLHFNRKNAEDISRLKVKSLISSMQPIKLFTIVIGLIWVVLVDIVIAKVFFIAPPAFLISAIIQVLLTKIAIGIYVYHMWLIQQVDISKPVMATQERLARLQSSTLWVTRILILQLPVWTTFYLNENMFNNGNLFLYLLQIIITSIFTLMALWLFINIKYENRHKKWFRILFAGKEWAPIIQSMELLNQVEVYKEEKTQTLTQP